MIGSDTPRTRESRN